MKTVSPEPDWPESWKYCYNYDLLEFYGSGDFPGYRYQYGNRFKAVIDAVTKRVKPGARILDVAAAQGNFTLKLAELGYRMTWNDLREDLEGYVRMKWEKGLVEYAPGNVFDLQEKEGFEAAIITEIIEHVAHPDDFLRRIATLVKPGGFIIMTTPLGNYIQNKLPRFSEFENPEVFESVQFKPNADGHIFLLHWDEVDKLGKQAGLEVDEKKLYTTFLTAGHMKTGFLLRIIPESVIRFFEKSAALLPLAFRLKISTNFLTVYRKPGQL